MASAPTACGDCARYEDEGVDGNSECHGYPPTILMGYDGKLTVKYPPVTATTVGCSVYEEAA